MKAAPRTAVSVLFALIVGHIGLHACMSGVRMAAPLQALREGHSEWAVGILLGLFAIAPVLLALHAGRMADRLGYHRPMRAAIAATAGGAGFALVGTWLVPAWPMLQFGVICVAATLCGTGANVALITMQRTAGRTARDPTEVKRVFSVLGLAPALSNASGPVVTGMLIDIGGFRTAFAALTLLPLTALWCIARVPHEAPVEAAARTERGSSLELLRLPGMRRVLLVNWLVAASWDVHAFLVPILGHERGFSASAIGFVLGVFALAVTGVRGVIPLLAHHLRESQVLTGAMLGTAMVFGLYPFAVASWQMATLAVLLGVALGCVQPMVMSAMHQITPHHRQGEAIALRSMTINFSSAVMPLLFGLLGSAVGASALFWLMGAIVGSGSWPARRVRSSDG